MHKTQVLILNIFFPNNCKIYFSCRTPEKYRLYIFQEDKVLFLLPNKNCCKLQPVPPYHHNPHLSQHRCVKETFSARHSGSKSKPKMTDMKLEIMQYIVFYHCLSPLTYLFHTKKSFQLFSFHQPWNHPNLQ